MTRDFINAVPIAHLPEAANPAIRDEHDDTVWDVDGAIQSAQMTTSLICARTDSQDRYRPPDAMSAKKHHAQNEVTAASRADRDAPG